MSIKDLLPQEKVVSTEVFFRSNQATATVIQILQGKQLKEHYAFRYSDPLLKSRENAE